MLPYVAAQLVGSSLVKLVATEDSTLGATLPAHGMGQAFGLELFLTFGLMLVILRVTATSYEQGLLMGLAIGAVVELEALVAGPLCASMNPTRSLPQLW